MEIGSAHAPIPLADALGDLSGHKDRLLTYQVCFLGVDTAVFLRLLSLVVVAIMRVLEVGKQEPFGVIQ